MKHGILSCLLIFCTLVAHSQQLWSLEPPQSLNNPWVPTTPDSLYWLPSYQISTKGDTLDLEKNEGYSSIHYNKSAYYRYVKRDDKPVTLRYGEYKAILRRLARLEKERR